MYIETIKDKLFQQKNEYQALKNGNVDAVRYMEYRDKEWGIRDANYINRMRLAYYLLYAKIEDKDTIVYLFQEELKDRKSNSFQGIGDTLLVLTTMLNRYNMEGTYDELLDEAKNANFDCACGFDKNYQVDDDINTMDLMDCIFLARDLDYKDVAEVLVDRWKNSIDEWTDEYRTTLIDFNSFLGKEKENEEIYKVLLDNTIRLGKTNDIVSVYNQVIRYYIDAKSFENAYLYLKRMIDTIHLDEIKGIRLFGDVLEECFEIICGYPNVSKELWRWAKPYLKEQTKGNMYGNLYIKGLEAAKYVDDFYAVILEKKYLKWRTEVGV